MIPSGVSLRIPRHARCASRGRSQGSALPTMGIPRHWGRGRRLASTVRVPVKAWSWPLLLVFSSCEQPYWACWCVSPPMRRSFTLPLHRLYTASMRRSGRAAEGMRPCALRLQALPVGPDRQGTRERRERRTRRRARPWAFCTAHPRNCRYRSLHAPTWRAREEDMRACVCVRACVRVCE